MSGRLPGIDGLRALAAAAVLAHHTVLMGARDGTLPAPVAEAGQNLRWGLVLFFALSGFLLFRPFAAAIVDGRPLPSLRGYGRNRVLRIAPAYWVILLVVAIAGLTATWTGDRTGMPSAEVLLADLLLVQNYTNETALTGIGPAWSLCVEVAFYVTLPVLALWAARRAARGPVAALLTAAGALVAVGLAGKALLAAGAFPASWGYVPRLLMPVHADLFGIGMAAAVAHVLAERGRLAVPRWAVPAALALVAVTWVADERLGVAGSGELSDTVIGVACALLVLAMCRPGAAPRLLEARPVAWFGLVSYSAYLWHVPVLTALRELDVTASGTAATVALGALVLAVTAALSAVTYRFVEAPALALKGPRRAPLPEPAVALATPR